jgi:hypothetical protein
VTARIDSKEQTLSLSDVHKIALFSTDNTYNTVADSFSESAIDYQIQTEWPRSKIKDKILSRPKEKLRTVLGPYVQSLKSYNIL